MNTQRGKRMDDIEVGGEREKASGLHSPDDVELLSAMGIREGKAQDGSAAASLRACWQTWGKIKTLIKAGQLQAEGQLGEDVWTDKHTNTRAKHNHHGAIKAVVRCSDGKKCMLTSMERSLADPKPKTGLKLLTNDTLVGKTGVNTFIVLYSSFQLANVEKWFVTVAKGADGIFKQIKRSAFSFFKMIHAYCIFFVPHKSSPFIYDLPIQDKLLNLVVLSCKNAFCESGKTFKGTVHPKNEMFQTCMNGKDIFLVIYWKSVGSSVLNLQYSSKYCVPQKKLITQVEYMNNE